MRLIKAGILMIAFFLLMVSAAKTEDKNLMDALSGSDTGCGKTSVQIYEGDFYIPTQVAVQAWSDEVKGERTVEYFKGKSFIDVMFMYLKAVKANLKAPSESNLDCAFGLVTSWEGIVSRSYTDALTDIQKGNSTGTYEGIALINELWEGMICKDYNEIALQYKRNGKTEKSEDIYRYIMRHFDRDRYAACFKEAEISLQGLIK